MCDDVRKRMVERALAVCGWECVNPVQRELFRDLIGKSPKGTHWPLDRPYVEGRAPGANGISTCVMVALGLLRELRPADPRLSDAYEPGEGIAHLRRAALDAGAWQAPVRGSDLRPEPGDIVCVDRPMHVCVCVDWGGIDVPLMLSVDGGQTGQAGLQSIHRCSRRWMVQDDGRVLLGNRPVLGWVVLDLLEFKQ